MKKTMTIIAIAIAVGIAAVSALKINSLTTVQAAAPLFGDACKNVKFTVKNQHNSGGQIEIREVQYFNKANGKWQTEQVANKTANQGATVTTNGDDLKDSEGEQITKIKFKYKYLPTGRGANWSMKSRARNLCRAARPATPTARMEPSR
ncbi:MAG: hypothetical protein U0Y68_26685 [Blastocatellia bacterium]